MPVSLPKANSHICFRAKMAISRLKPAVMVCRMSRFKVDTRDPYARVVCRLRRYDFASKKTLRYDVTVYHTSLFV